MNFRSGVNCHLTVIEERRSRPPDLLTGAVVPVLSGLALPFWIRIKVLHGFGYHLVLLGVLPHFHEDVTGTGHGDIKQATSFPDDGVPEVLIVADSGDTVNPAFHIFRQTFRARAQLRDISEVVARIEVA